MYSPVSNTKGTLGFQSSNESKKKDFLVEKLMEELQALVRESELAIFLL